MIGNVITSIGVGGTVERAELNLPYTLPAADGSSNQVLQTDGSGTLSWGTGESNWSESSGDIYRSSGDVGIGTASPSQKLHIHAGGIYATPVAYVGNADEWLLRTGAWNNDEWDYGGIKVRCTSSGTPRLAFMDFVSAEVLSVESNKIGIGTGNTTPSAKLHVNGDIIRLQSSKTPASASASGNTGDICWDTGYLYVCTDTDTWKRATISAW